MRHVIERHKVKILIGFPLFILIASSLGFAESGETFVLKPENVYLEVGSTTAVDVVVDSNEPINVVGGTIVLPPELTLVDVSLENTVVDLWTKEPTFQDDATSIPFAGGIIRPGGFTGDGVIVSFTVEAREAGAAEILLNRPEVKAHDGEGTEVLRENIPITISIREEGQPSPDLNQDNRVSVRDLGILSTKLFTSYDPIYDFNDDKRISIGDILILFRNLSIY